MQRAWLACDQPADQEGSDMGKLAMMVLVCAVGLGLTPEASAGPPGKGSDLPPGLQKKVARGGELPPGWKDKLQVGHQLDRDIFDQHGVILRPVNDAGIIEVRVDNEILHVLHHSLEIVDILSR